MMADLMEIVRFLDWTLRNEEFEDDSLNGLQVEGRREVRRITAGVDACRDLLERAPDADLFLVHHGILWKDGSRLVGPLGARVRLLHERNQSLYASHLPLDAHRDYGNNILLSRLLDLAEPERFGNYHGTVIGWKGILDPPRALSQIIDCLKEKLSAEVIPLAFGPKTIRTVGVVSGGGCGALSQAIEQKLDLFITGEPDHWIYHEAKEAGLNVLLAGHYSTETLGVRALAEAAAKEFSIDVSFADIPTKV